MPSGEWLFSYPKFHRPVNLDKISAAFAEFEPKLQTTLSSPGFDGPLIAGVEAGMGIGKSHAIDIVDQVLFKGRNPLVLKVTYNRNQTLSVEKSSEIAAKQGLWARAALSVHRKVGPENPQVSIRCVSRIVKHYGYPSCFVSPDPEGARYL